MITRSRLVGILGVVVLGAIVLATPTAEDPDTIAAFRRYVANLGLEVADIDALPDEHATAVVVSDVRTPEEVDELLSWVERGGMLLITDPGSNTAAALGVSQGEPVGLAGTASLTPQCIAPPVVDVERIVVRAGDRALNADDDRFVACFPAAGGALMLTTSHGAGVVTILGGPSLFTNGLLSQEDNAILAMRLVEAGQTVAFAGPGGAAANARGGVWEALPDGAQAGILVAIGAAVAFALVRARRLGPPMLETPIAPIPASELVRATARMYRRSRSVGHAATQLRAATIDRLAARLGAAHSGEAVARAAARVTGMAEPEVSHMLTASEPRTDEDLIQFGRALHDLETRIQEGSG